MATVHPSRMGLVPQDRSTSTDQRYGRPSSPQKTNGRARSPTPRRDEGRDSDRNGRRHDSRSERDAGRRDRARADDYFDGERRESERRGRTRSRSVDKQRDREREERDKQERPRRPSPEYSEYKRPSSPRREDAAAPAPWRQQENMYPNRRDRPPHIINGYGGGGGGGGGGGADFMDRYVLFCYFVRRCVLTISAVGDSSGTTARSLYGLRLRRHQQDRESR